MGILKKTAEDVSVALDKVRHLRVWASVSASRAQLVATLLFAVFGAIYYTYGNYLLAEERKALDNRYREIKAHGDELNYKVALDAITTCLESAKEKPTLNAWYCAQAVVQYRNVSTDQPQERVKEVIDKHAYAAMKNDVSHYLRSLEHYRLITSPIYEEEETLEWLYGKKGIVIGLFVLLALPNVAYLYFWILPNRKRGTPDA